MGNHGGGGNVFAAGHAPALAFAARRAGATSRQAATAAGASSGAPKAGAPKAVARLHAAAAAYQATHPEAPPEVRGTGRYDQRLQSVGAADESRLNPYGPPDPKALLDIYGPHQLGAALWRYSNRTPEDFQAMARAAGVAVKPTASKAEIIARITEALTRGPNGETRYSGAKAPPAPKAPKAAPGARAPRAPGSAPKAAGSAPKAPRATGPRAAGTPKSGGAKSGGAKSGGAKSGGAKAPSIRVTSGPRHDGVRAVRYEYVPAGRTPLSREYIEITRAPGGGYDAQAHVTNFHDVGSTAGDARHFADAAAVNAYLQSDAGYGGEAAKVLGYSVPSFDPKALEG